MRLTDHPEPEAHIAEAQIAETLLSAPGWARIGITAPSQPLREAAARELARAILDREAMGGRPGPSPDQLQLFP